MVQCFCLELSPSHNHLCKRMPGGRSGMRAVFRSSVFPMEIKALYLILATNRQWTMAIITLSLRRQAGFTIGTEAISAPFLAIARFSYFFHDWYDVALVFSESSAAVELPPFSPRLCRTLTQLRYYNSLNHTLGRKYQRGNIYSLDESRRDTWEDPVREYVDKLRVGKGESGWKYSYRFVGSAVADVHRTLVSL